MFKKISIILVCIGLIGAISYQYRIELLITFVKYRTQLTTEISPPRELPWQQGPKEASASIDDRSPNIILIVADDLGYNDISAFGGGLDGGRIKTPAIDSLANEGVAFTQSYSAANTCAPSRASIMTGRYPLRTGFEYTPLFKNMTKIVAGLYNNLDTNLPPSIYDEKLEKAQPDFLNKALPLEEVTIAEMLKSKGYYTAHIGKWHLGASPKFLPNKQGFDDSLYMSGGLYLPEDHPDAVNARLAFDPIDQFLWARLTYGNHFNGNTQDIFEPNGYMTDYWTDQAQEVIRANKNRPFFLYLAHWGVHTPLQASREDYEAVGDIKPHRKRVYAAMIRSIDRSIAGILETLEEEGLAENTIIVFTSDNGGAGYIGIPEINQPYRGWKLTNFEGGIRVPMLVRWPNGGISGGEQINTPVAHIDILPTLAAAAQTPLPEGVTIDGKNIMSLVKGNQNWDRDTLFWRNDHYQVVRHGDWKLQVNDRPVGGYMSWLFDLKKDPTEQNNLAQDNPEKVAELLALLKAHNSNARKPVFESTIEVPVMIDKTLDQMFDKSDEYVYTPN